MSYVGFILPLRSNCLDKAVVQAAHYQEQGLEEPVRRARAQGTPHMSSTSFFFVFSFLSLFFLFFQSLFFSLILILFVFFNILLEAKAQSLEEVIRAEEVGLGKGVAGARGHGETEVWLSSRWLSKQ